MFFSDGPADNSLSVYFIIIIILLSVHHPISFMAKLKGNILTTSESTVGENTLVFEFHVVIP